MTRLALIATLLLLAACNCKTAVPTTEENAQMYDAANLLDQAPADLGNIDDDGLNADANPLP
jgi:hypothetical protein